MAESKERRKAPRKAIQATPRPDTGLATSSEDTRRRIAEAAYFRAKERNFEPGGPAKYQVKDTSTALGFARDHGLRLPVSEEVDRLFQAMVDHRDGDLDHSAVILELQRMNSGGDSTA